MSHYVAIFAVVLCVTSGCSTVTALPTAVPEELLPTATTCAYHGQLPDPICTPGVADPRVMQSNIMTTICKSGYTVTVRPPTSYTEPLKLQQMRAYGVDRQSPSGFEEDHLISRKLGGSPTDPRNLWPEPGGSPNPKDTVENRLHTMVCQGTLTLVNAQQRIATDWTTALSQ